ncbi:sugar O-acetyltransferase [Photobacterium sp. NCIMB 13483]|uniref:Acetyltransferase n=1 Tax=Photobacterium piscicola TaxID=1378299 RepID=A0A1T5I0J2_9GAMM|nr:MULTISPECIES: sugar O-acetyltransferase [Photobacterium]PST85456.1 sugar O-acetyltransferase [Photobacterium sp. NCIMB 13483]SKC32574.1 Galactoside O-acetyltransferase [Photobacterium piscicola]
MIVNPEDKLHSQQVYACDDALAERQLACLEVLYDFNHTRPSEIEKRTQLMQQLFAEVGEGCYIEPPLHANWGKHTHLGRNVYVNFNLTLVDDTHIYIGNDVMIGPNVTIATAGHPIDPLRRQQVTQFNIPVTIGNNVWIGAQCVILPGISIGDNTVIGAGSIVTRDIPSNVVAMGNPCNVSREINEHDKIYFYKEKRY